MKPKLTTSMLLIGVVLLGAFIWFFERDGETSHQKKQRTQTVFSVYPESIHSLLLERDGVQIECSKAGGTWRLIRPTDAPVNAGIVEQMIAGMARVERGELITAETLKDRDLSPADYGFDEPRARITFQNSRGTFTWLIGRDAPLGDMLYIISESGGDIIAAPQTLLNLVPEDAAWIRDHALFRDDIASVRGIDLRRQSGFLQLRHPENNGWLMQQPHKSRANILRVHALIENILAARIEKFITDEKTDLTIYGLEDPSCELTLFTQDEKTQTLYVGKPSPDQPDTHYAKWAEKDSVFTVLEEWVKLFDIEEDPLRSRQLLGVLPARITELQITRGEQQVSLTQTNGSWQITRPAQWNTEPSQVKELLQTLALALVLNFVDDPSVEQTQLMADAPWSILFTENGETHTLRISEGNSEGIRLVQRDNEVFFYATDAGVINESFIDPLFFRTRTVLQIDPSQIKKIAQKDGEEEWSVQNIENTFTAPDQTQQINSEAIFELISQLMDLQATRYVAFNPDSLAPYGLDKPAFRLSITLNGTNTLGRVVLLGNDVEGGHFAMVQGEEIIFILPNETTQALIQKLTQPLTPAKPEIPKLETPKDPTLQNKN